MILNIYKLSKAQRTVLQYLRHLRPLLSPSFVPRPTSEKIIDKVFHDLDLYSPFRQHAPSLANAIHKIYANVNEFPSENGAGFFNVLAFRGVFFDRLSHNQIGTDGSTHLMIGKGFIWRERR